LKKILLAAAAATLVSVAVAHHSAAMFDHSKTITLKGTVKEFQFTNPHSWLQVLVTGPDGKTVEWGLESEGPSTLLRAGIQARSFKPGEKVTVVANPMRDGRPAGALLSVTRADGTVYSLRPGPPPGSKPAPAKS
jgi:hypothetical protein